MDDRKEARPYSQLSEYVKRGEAYRLGRIVRSPNGHGWWLPGGTAVHATIERWIELQVWGPAWVSPEEKRKPDLR